MSRFYNTSASTFIDDKMYQLPADLMYNTIMKKDTAIDNVIKEASTVRDTLKTENLKSDDPAVNARLKEYEDKINSYTDNIYSKPLDFKRQQGNLMRLSRDIDSDMQHGLLSKAQDQFDSQKTFNEGVDARKDISEDKKKMSKRLAEIDYEIANGLNYKDDGSYNSYTDFTTAVHADVDIGEIMTKVGTNFKPDKSSKAWSNPDNAGYFRSGTHDRTELKEADVAIVMNSALNEAGWEDEQRQLIEMEIRLGRREDSFNIEDELVARRKGIVDAAKVKFGYKQETKTSKMSTDSTFMQREGRANSKAVGEGVILSEQRDPRESIFTNSDTATLDGYGKKINGVISQRLGVESFNELVDMTFKNSNTIDTKDAQGNVIAPSRANAFKELRTVLKSEGMTEVQFVDYVNYMNTAENLDTPHKDGYDMSNPRDVAEQKSHMKALMLGFNSMSPNEPVKSMRILKDNGVYETLDNKSIGDLVANGDENYLYTPVTGTRTVMIPATDSDGNLIDALSGFAFQTSDKKTKEVTKYKTKEDLPPEMQGNVKMVKGTEPYYDSTGPLLKVTAGNLRQNKVYQINLSGATIDDKEYVVSQHYFRENRRTGKKEVITLDVKFYSNHIQVK